ncbi:hypothetical protein ACH5RR_026316 [Cinchona calisaya]|uniref:Uncharacterized protein n=1 Tax=Cinchona calisaya TaxID=153742 RepID=A0ABD2Z277_9GENT
MSAVFGWYGPLIDLSKASSHVGDYVQLLVFVHKSTPVQYKLSKQGSSAAGGRGGELIRMDVQVGDDTRRYFPVSIWQKQFSSKIVAGDIILLQNVKVARFRDVVEARTQQCSSVQSLVHSKELLVSKGIDEIMKDCRIGITAKNKLHKVIDWVQRAGLASCDVESNSNQSNKQLFINWKMHEEVQYKDCLSLMQVKHLPDASKATFHASVGEIFLPITWRHVPESEVEKMFISRRICMLGDKNFVDDLICNGCQLCGIPLPSDFGSQIEQNNFPLYCERSQNGLHSVSMIYRPFMLYVWDDSQCIPLLVANKAAELLFGNITAEKVYSGYEREKQRRNISASVVYDPNQSCERTKNNLNVAKCCISDSPLSSIDGKRRQKLHQVCGKPNQYLIWIILLKMLLKQGKNSPLKFSIKVNLSIDSQTGRYEMLSVSMPPSCKKSSPV